MVFVNVLLLVGFALVLVKSTQIVMGALKHIIRATRLGQFGVTAFILALATSLPELMVGVVAALEGKSALVLGNVLGSNIANLSLVIGGAVIVGGGIKVVGEFLRRDLFLTFFVGSLPLILLIDGALTATDGMVLLIVYAVYVITVLRERSEDLGKSGLDEPVFRRLLGFLHKSRVERDLGVFLMGVAMLLFSSHMIVQLAESIAVGFGVPVFLVGLFLVAIGTSLPELVFEISAVKSGNIGMVFGDLLGSVAANSTLILGITSLIMPLRLDGGLRPYLYATISFVVIFLVFWLFVSTKKRLERWEAVVLLLMYLGFVLVEVM